MPRIYGNKTAAEWRRDLKAELRQLDAPGLSVYGPVSGNGAFVQLTGHGGWEPPLNIEGAAELSDGAGKDAVVAARCSAPESACRFTGANAEPWQRWWAKYDA